VLQSMKCSRETPTPLTPVVQLRAAETIVSPDANKAVHRANNLRRSLATMRRQGCIHLDSSERGYRDHRSFGLRQVYAAALFQLGCTRTVPLARVEGSVAILGSSIMERARAQSPFVVTWEWCPEPDPLPTMSDPRQRRGRPARRCKESRGTWRDQRHIKRSASARGLWPEVKASSMRARWRSPEDSSSDSVSRARSPRDRE